MMEKKGRNKKKKDEERKKIIKMKINWKIMTTVNYEEWKEKPDERIGLDQ